MTSEGCVQSSEKIQEELDRRLFHPHTRDQVEAFMKGDKVYWWFSDKAIREHAQTRLELVPDVAAIE